MIYVPNFIDDIGIYTNIHESGNRSKNRHKLYYATCKLCNTTVEKPLMDIKRNNTLCYHENGYYKQATGKVNDMPKGWMGQSKLNQRIYSMWKAMHERSTEKYWEKYPTYTGTTVSDEWKYLSNFVNDIKELEGYDKWVSAGKNEMMFDKDTIIDGNKHYSKETCRFISHTESNQDVARRHPEKIYKAVSVVAEKYSKKIKAIDVNTKETIIFSSQKEASRELGVLASHIWMILSDDEKYASHKTTKSKDGRRWTFEEV